MARLEERLAGDTSEERFASFVAQFRDLERVRTLYEEYPVLARLIAEQTNRWVAGSLELLERLTIDFPALQEAFGGGEALGPLATVSGGLADPHKGGRSVAIVRFRSGTRIVYKPKSLAVDAHFQELLRWVTAEGFVPGFRTLTILDRGDYGWVEFASREACRTQEEVTRFYERTGGYLALLYVTDATDVHSGNLVASGEHPFLIDLEALFHPHRSAPLSPERASADALAGRLLRYSVLRIGLLPERVWENADHAGVDISGLGAPAGQMTPRPVPDWEKSGTDSMQFVRKHKTIAAESNRPTFDGQAVDASEHRDAILRGFRSLYAVLAAHSEELLAAEGPLTRFARDPVSVFLRASRTYRRLLRESYHPDVLRDALDRDRLFDLLWAEVPGDPRLTKVIRDERDDLWHGDIPCFSAHPESRDLWSGEGTCLADFFHESSLASVRRIVDTLGASDCARQAWCIEASLATLPGSSTRSPSYPAARSASAIDRDRLLASAAAVGDRLEQLAVHGAEDAAWIGLGQHGRRRHWSIHRAGLDLESGLTGIALFLAYLGRVTGRESTSVLAQAALPTLRRALADPERALGGIGGFDGMGGVIYGLSHLATLWGRTDIASEAEALLTPLSERFADDPDDADDAHDEALNGAASCILALRSLQHCLPSDRLTSLAVRCGDHLVRTGPQPARGPGIAHALFELAKWTGLERFREAAAGALHPEGSGAQAAEGADSWTAWSEGSAGAVLCRLSCPPDTWSRPGERADLAAAARTTLERSFGRSHALGHGDLGSLELLARTAALLQTEDLEWQAGAMAGAILADIEQNGWRCATPLGVETPGLLAGLAGIGYGLLRIAQPDTVPSVLALEPPLESWRAHGG